MDEVDRLNQLALESLDRREPDDRVVERCEILGCEEDAVHGRAVCPEHQRQIEGTRTWPG